VQSGESEEEEVMGKEIGEQKMDELVPEWGLQRDKGSWFQRQMKHNGRIDQLFLERMMKLAEQE